MLIETVKKYYDKSFNLNCAETIVYAANEEYNLNLNRDALKMMASFGGGMGIESICGAITGSLSVLGIMFVKEKGHESNFIKSLSREFFQRFEAKFGTKDCDQLKAKYRNDEIRCSIMIYKAAEVLDEIIKENEEKRVK
ncbi:MAG: C-GCAxxG-C-C family protein [Bacillota bacterium]|nr:C-GCAxxG-C-C family protein [Bacillota bacterium]